MSNIKATAQPRPNGKITIRIQLVDWYPDQIHTFTRYLANQSGLVDPDLARTLTRLARAISGATDQLLEHRHRP